MTTIDGMLTRVAEGSEYALWSSQDGCAYVLRFKSDGLSAHLRGDDAIRFQADYATIIKLFPAWQADQTLAQLWDQGGYSWLAVEDGGC